MTSTTPNNSETLRQIAIKLQGSGEREYPISPLVEENQLNLQAHNNPFTNFAPPIDNQVIRGAVDSNDPNGVLIPNGE
jgi:hypothetical protein